MILHWLSLHSLLNGDAMSRDHYIHPNIHTTRMKQVLIPVIVGLVTGASGFYLGSVQGHKDAQSVAQFEESMKSAEDLRKDLGTKEAEDISKYISGKTSIDSRDVGGLFNVKIANYLTGFVKNDASVVKAKDIQIKIDFLSKTEAVIGSKEITVYEVLGPGQSVEFKEAVEVPEKVESFKWTVLSAKPIV